MRSRRSGASVPAVPDKPPPLTVLGPQAAIRSRWDHTNRESGQQTKRLLKDEIDKLRLKLSRSVDNEAVRLLGKAANTLEEAANAPRRLVLVFRRLPLTVRYSTRTTTMDVNFETMKAARDVEGEVRPVTGLWRLVWPYGAIDFRNLFAPEFPQDRVLIIGDPGIDLSRLASDLESQENLRTRLTNFLTLHNMVPVHLSEAARKERYSEELLYPLFHYRTPPIGTGFSHLDWPAYIEANKEFCAAIAAKYEVGDHFLVFNYHLMLLPQQLRQCSSMKHAPIYFYLQTVFPSSEMYRILPQRQELLTGILHANIVGFHSHQYRGHFLTAVTRVLGAECNDTHIEPCVASGGSGVRVCVTPQGINVPAWEEAAEKIDVSTLKERFQGKKIILGVDALDYTKGIPQKMMALRMFLSENPEWANKIVFLQLCYLGKNSLVDSDNAATSFRLSQIDRKDILAQAYQVTGSVNSYFGTVEDVPVHFLTSDYSIEELAPLYAVADVVILTALRESMCVAINQFVLCQKGTNKGAIILSEFSGSSQLLGAAVLPANPWDVHSVAAAIGDALTMSEEERAARYDLAYQVVSKGDSKAWARQILIDLEDNLYEGEEDRLEIPPPLPISDCVQELTRCRHTVVVSGLRESLLRTPPALLDQEAFFPQDSEEVFNNDIDSDDEQYSIERSPAQVGVEQQQDVRTPSNTMSPYLPPSPSPLALALPRTTEGDVNSLSRPQGPSSVIVISSSSVPVVKAVTQDCPNVWAFAENGHYVRVPGTTEFLPLTLPVEQSSVGTEAGAGTLIHETSSRSMTPDASGSDSSLGECLQKVQELVEYFSRRTPGSHVRKTDLSVSWHYASADKQFATNQARDLLFHLRGGPLLNNPNLELCIGKSSVEVRACRVTKWQAVEWALKQICEEKDIRPTEMGILCVGNYLPRDEELYAWLARFVSGGTIRTPSRHSLSHHTDTPLVTRAVSKKIAGCYTTTVGLRLSKAAYRLESNATARHLLRRLAEALHTDIPRAPSEFDLIFPVSPTQVRSGGSPTLDVAMALAGTNQRLTKAYYDYHPAVRERMLARRLSVKGGRQWPLSTSDAEDDEPESEDEFLIMNAGTMLNVPHGIPFTHARQAWPAVSTTVPELPSAITPSSLWGGSGDISGAVSPVAPLVTIPSGEPQSPQYFTPPSPSSDTILQ